MADEEDGHNTEEHHGQAHLLPLAPDHQDHTNWNGGKYAPGQSCPFLGGFSDLHVDEDVQDGQEGEGKDVHEEEVQPSHVDLMNEWKINTLFPQYFPIVQKYFHHKYIF